MSERSGLPWIPNNDLYRRAFAGEPIELTIDLYSDTIAVKRAAVMVPFVGQTSPDPPPGFRRAKPTPPATLADLETQLIGTDAEKAPFLAAAAEMMGLPNPATAAIEDPLGGLGLAMEHRAELNRLLLTIFNDDGAAISKWLIERCDAAPVRGKPIDVLKEGGVERVLTFLRQAVP